MFVDVSASKDDSELSESIVAISADGSGKKKGKTPKPKKPKDATKKPARKERAKANRKAATDFKKHKGAEIMEDPDLDKEIDVLATGGLKNQVQTLQLSRLFGKILSRTLKFHTSIVSFIDSWMLFLKLQCGRNYKKPNYDCYRYCAMVSYHVVDSSLTIMVYN